MGSQTNIAWADSTFNPWIGCTKISPGCDHCYAERGMSKRLKRVEWGAGAQRSRTSPGNWQKPVTWNAQPYFQCGCGHRGTIEELTTNTVHSCDLQFRPARRRVFCASLADVFDNDVDPQWRADLLDLIEATPNLDWLLLTKRIGNVVKLLTDLRDSERSDRKWGYLNAWIKHGRPPENVWLGATICDQAEADRDIPKLLATPAAVRFLSIEPMIGPIDITEWLWGRAEPCDDCPKDADCMCSWYPRSGLGGEECLHWVIAGGESGPHARPSHPDWFVSLRDQCADAKVPFFFKQWSEWGQGFDDVEETRNIAAPVRYFPELGRSFARVGVHAAGRKLDGVEHNAFPVGCLR